MIRSIVRYAQLFGSTLLLKSERAVVWNHFLDWYLKRSFQKKEYTRTEKKESLHNACEWLLSSFKNMTDGGSGTYYITKGWSSSYPETSGYIIPTMYTWSKMVPEKQDEIKRIIQRCADWLLDIQKPSGGWQSAYIEHQRPEVVFNTGQVIRGLLTAYEIWQDKKYLDACQKACEWLYKSQEEDGSWIKTAYMNQPRVYDSYVAHPMLMVWKLTGDENIKISAEKNLNWIIKTQQESNGWFNNADNTIKHNNRPILHTVSYTIDGLIHCGLMLNQPEYIDAGKKAADRLLHIFYEEDLLKGRYNKNWVPEEYIICTGCAQISIIWGELWKITGDEKYLHASEKMNHQLITIQNLSAAKKMQGYGALPGSFPLWGKYEPFAYPNWATKYFADALMLELQQTENLFQHLQSHENYQ